MKQWNIGNTTVRNPERIKAGLSVLSDKFTGRTFDIDTQEEFYSELKNSGLIEGDPDKDSSRAHTARKWASAFNQLGFARCWEKFPPIEITPPGKALLEETIEYNDIYLRQLLKLQLPSPLERGSDDFSVHPLFVVIKTAYLLGEKGYKGLYRDEIALFIQTTISDSDIDQNIEKIIKYRDEKSSVEGRVNKSRYFRLQIINKIKTVYEEEFSKRQKLLISIYEESLRDIGYLQSDEFKEKIIQITLTGKGPNVAKSVRARANLIKCLHSRAPFQELENILAEHFLGTKANTLIDYSDTTIRYSMMTGIFTINGSALVIKQDRIHFVENLISSGNPAFLKGKVFWGHYYNALLPVIPTDNEEFLKKDLEILRKQALEVGVDESKIDNSYMHGTLPALKKYRNQLENQILEKNEYKFYKEQSSEGAVEDIKSVFDKIFNREIIGGSDYYPAWTEWAVWRVFLSINTISNSISETRNFRIDTDLNPIHHAKAGVADMVFRYDENFVLPTEVTLNTGERQYAVEREPVQTHVLHIAEDCPTLEVIGLFVAPEINPRTAHTFLNVQEWSNKLNRNIELTIIPMTVSQLISLLPGEANACANSNELKTKLLSLKNLKPSCHNGVEWLSQIQQVLGN